MSDRNFDYNVDSLKNFKGYFPDLFIGNQITRAFDSSLAGSPPVVKGIQGVLPSVESDDNYVYGEPQAIPTTQMGNMYTFFKKDKNTNQWTTNIIQYDNGFVISNLMQDVFPVITDGEDMNFLYSNTFQPLQIYIDNGSGGYEVLRLLLVTVYTDAGKRELRAYIKDSIEDYYVLSADIETELDGSTEFQAFSIGTGLMALGGFDIHPTTYTVVKQAENSYSITKVNQDTSDYYCGIFAMGMRYGTTDTKVMCYKPSEMKDYLLTVNGTTGMIDMANPIASNYTERQNDIELQVVCNSSQTVYMTFNCMNYWYNYFDGTNISQAEQFSWEGLCPDASGSQFKKGFIYDGTDFYVCTTRGEYTVLIDSKGGATTNSKVMKTAGLPEYERTNVPELLAICKV